MPAAGSGFPPSGIRRQGPGGPIDEPPVRQAPCQRYVAFTPPHDDGTVATACCTMAG